VGETPFKGSYKTGKYLLRLVPEGSSDNLIPYETQISLTSGTETVIYRLFAKSEDESSGYVVSFDKAKKGSAELNITSDPENAQVTIDGISKGFTPYVISAIVPAEHKVIVRSPNHQDFSKAVKTVSGYRLTVFVKLGRGIATSDTALPQASPKTFSKIVTILKNSMGYVNLNSQPGGVGETLTRLSPGEKFPYIDTDVATGWVEIKYQASASGNVTDGWVEGKYASISEQ
jgi:hypothetical protein